MLHYTCSAFVTYFTKYYLLSILNAKPKIVYVKRSRLLLLLVTYIILLFMMHLLNFEDKVWLFQTENNFVKFHLDC